MRDRIFTISSMLTLGLAIGATTAIFAAFKTVLLDPLPFDESDRLVMLWEQDRDAEPQQCGLGTIAHWQEENTVFDSIGFLANESAPYDRTKWSQGNMRNFLVSFGESAARVRGRHVSSSMFDVLRITPVLGRALEPGDDVAGAEPVAVVSHEYWRRFHEGQSDVLEQAINVTDKRGRNFTPYRIVGVLPQEARFPPDADFWLSYSGLKDHDPTAFRGTAWAIGRLKQGVSLERARHTMNVLQKRLYDQNVEAHFELGEEVRVTPLLEQMTGRDSRVLLSMLFVCVLFVLLIACVNIAQLLLARGAARTKEMAVRIALGASPVRILRQLTTENLLLATGSSIVGVLLAKATCRWLPSLDPGRTLGTGQLRHNRLSEIEIDSGAFAFALLTAVATALVFGLAPALQSIRVNVNNNLKADGRGSAGTRSSRLARNCLVVTAMVFAMVLVSGAGIMIESLRNLLNVDVGMAAETVLVADIDMPLALREEYSGRKQDVTNQLLAKVGAISGIESVAATSDLPMVETEWATRLSIQGRDQAVGRLPEVWGRTCTPGVFDTFGIELLAGRDFSEEDGFAAERVMIVNECFAEEHFPGDDAVGQVVFIEDTRERMDPRERTGIKKKIVGVVQNVRSPRLAGRVKPEFYVPYEQNYYWDGPEVGPLLIIRTDSLNPLKYVSQIRERVESKATHGRILVNFRTVPDILVTTTAEPRFAATLLSLFALLAILLAAVGFYGVFSHGLNERRREVGVRVALGAIPTDILIMFLREASTLALVGIAIGALIATLSAKMLSSLLVDIEPFNPATYAVVALVLLAIVLATTAMATRSAFRIQAADVLR